MPQLFLSALMQAKDVAETGAKAGLTLIESSALGAVLVVSIVINILIIRTLIRVQDRRVDDKEKDGERNGKLNEKLVTVFSEFKNSLDNLTAAEKLPPVR